MKITSAQYTDEKETTIKATIDGIEMFVPTSAGNRHYQEIIKQKIEIAPYDGVGIK